MQNQVASRIFHRMKPLKMHPTLPYVGIHQGPMIPFLETRAKAVTELRTKLEKIEQQIAPNPLMHRHGETNKLGEYSPYLPPLQIPGEGTIKRVF